MNGFYASIVNSYQYLGTAILGNQQRTSIASVVCLHNCGSYKHVCVISQIKTGFVKRIIFLILIILLKDRKIYRLYLRKKLNEHQRRHNCQNSPKMRNQQNSEEQCLLIPPPPPHYPFDVAKSIKWIEWQGMMYQQNDKYRGSTKPVKLQKLMCELNNKV